MKEKNGNFCFLSFLLFLCVLLSFGLYFSVGKRELCFSIFSLSSFWVNLLFSSDSVTFSVAPPFLPFFPCFFPLETPFCMSSRSGCSLAYLYRFRHLLYKSVQICAGFSCVSVSFRSFAVLFCDLFGFGFRLEITWQCRRRWFCSCDRFDFPVDNWISFVCFLGCRSPEVFQMLCCQWLVFRGLFAAGCGDWGSTSVWFPESTAAGNELRLARFEEPERSHPSSYQIFRIRIAQIQWRSCCWMLTGRDESRALVVLCILDVSRIFYSWTPAASAVASDPLSSLVSDGNTNSRELRGGSSDGGCISKERSIGRKDTDLQFDGRGHDCLGRSDKDFGFDGCSDESVQSWWCRCVFRRMLHKSRIIIRCQEEFGAVKEKIYSEGSLVANEKSIMAKVRVQQNCKAQEIQQQQQQLARSLCPPTFTKIVLAGSLAASHSSGIVRAFLHNRYRWVFCTHKCLNLRWMNCCQLSQIYTPCQHTNCISGWVLRP